MRQYLDFAREMRNLLKMKARIMSVEVGVIVTVLLPWNREVNLYSPILMVDENTEEGAGGLVRLTNALLLLVPLPRQLLLLVIRINITLTRGRRKIIIHF